MSLTTELLLNLTTKEALVDGSEIVQMSKKISKSINLADLAGALGATLRFADTRTLTGTESLDFAGGVTDKLGNTKTFAKNKLLYLENTFTSGTITVGGGSNPFVGWFSGTIVLEPGEFVLFFSPTAAGKPVVGGTGDTLQVVASVAAMTYEIVFLGEP